MTRPSLAALAPLLLFALPPNLAASPQAMATAPLAWEASTGPFGGIVRRFAESDHGTIFAWVEGEIYRSRDDGRRWTRCESQPAPPRGSVESWLFTAGDRLYAMSEPGRTYYASRDDCASGEVVAAPPAKATASESVTSVDGVLFAVYGGPAVFRSRDDGVTWAALAAPAGARPRLAAHGSHVYLLASDALYRSADHGSTWTALAPTRVLELVTGGTFLIAVGSDFVRRSRDGGETWPQSLAWPVHEAGFRAASARGSTTLIAASKLARRSDDEAWWTPLPHPTRPRYGPFAVHVTQKNTLLAGTGIGVFRWETPESGWIATGAPGRRLNGLVASAGYVYATSGHSLWRSHDAGRTWTRVETAFASTPSPPNWPHAFARLLWAENTTVHASTDRELISSTDAGSTWATTGLDHGVYALIRSAGTWYAANNSGVFRSSDFKEWQECSHGLDALAVHAIVDTANGDLVVRTEAGFFRSTDRCGSWWPLPRQISGASAHVGNARPRPLPDADPPLGLLLDSNGASQLDVVSGKRSTGLPSSAITDAVRDSWGRYWVGTAAGVRLLEIEGDVWRLTSAGLDGPVRVLTIASDGWLIAAIDGHGMYRARLAGPGPQAASPLGASAVDWSAAAGFTPDQRW